MARKFNWKKCPKALEAVLQYIEDYIFNNMTAQDYANIAQHLLTELHPITPPTASAIEQKLRDTLCRTLRSNHSMIELCTYGPGVLDLEKLGCFITPNKKRCVPKSALARSSPKPKIAQTETQELLSPAGLLPKQNQPESSNRISAGTPSKRLHKGDEATESPAKRSRKIDSHPAKGTEVGKNDDHAVGSSPDSPLTILGSDPAAPDLGQNHGTTLNLAPQNVFRDSRTDSNPAYESPADQVIVNHSNQSFVDRCEKQDVMASAIEDETGNKETSASEDGDDGTGDDEASDDETSHDEASADETGDDGTGNEETSDSETGSDGHQPSGLRICNVIENSEPTDVLRQLGPISGHTQALAGASRRFQTQQATQAVRETIKTTRTAFKSANEAYRPSLPERQPYDPRLIGNAMKHLSFEIHCAVSIELHRRGIDLKAPFHLDENCFDAEFTSVIQFVFGQNLALCDIKQHLRRLQGTRRLEICTLLESLVAASITKHVFQKSPQGPTRDDSVESVYLDLVLDYFVEQNAMMTGVQYGKMDFKEFLHQYAVRNHILRDVMPQNDARAADLAFRMETQILAMFPAPPPETYCTFSKGSTLCHHRAVIRRQELAEQGVYAARIQSNNTQTESELYKDLKRIYKFALDERAKWEAEGEAKYEFRWPRYGEEFKHGHDFSEEENLDFERPHEVFVTTLPGVWARRRDHRERPWKEPECITMAYVYVLDPKYKE